MGAAPETDSLGEQFLKEAIGFNKEWRPGAGLAAFKNTAELKKLKKQKMGKNTLKSLGGPRLLSSDPPRSISSP